MLRREYRDEFYPALRKLGITVC